MNQVYIGNGSTLHWLTVKGGWFEVVGEKRPSRWAVFGLKGRNPLAEEEAIKEDATHGD